MTSGENYAVFRECLSNAVVARSEEKPKPTRRKPKGKRTERKDVKTAATLSTGRADPEELAEFVDVHAPGQSSPAQSNQPSGPTKPTYHSQQLTRLKANNPSS
jgi:hypothetical protein